ncbi:AraC family transcriptional regulator [Gracilibacillus alcaliphilus]|uniref:AraC family transcriptional regulator n=1 Tax=Gracilibacillus alcaliphilus TaxID=1401441 RepID=UPI001959668F|nr:AraC family transcriptional regulator [Gracilibacillus alcaliphilus]MBM7675526.1 AraC-like DNA-binding protein [Gracilibacillus alcaliphilus]
MEPLIIQHKQEQISQLIRRHIKNDGVYETSIPKLFLIKESLETEPVHRLYHPCFCVITQGEKEVQLADTTYRYGSFNYLVASADLPVTGKVIHATPSQPYLALKLEFTREQVLEVWEQCESLPLKSKQSDQALFVHQLDSDLLDAVERLLRLLDNPKDIAVLAPIFMKEILYKVLQGPYGRVLAQMVLEDSHAYQVREIIAYMVNNYDKKIKIKELSEMVNMSPASLHRHFKAVTTMTPIQFQKQIRLQEARRLLLAEPVDITQVVFRVGYESSSQFSREYSRMFGRSPREDQMAVKRKYRQQVNG